MKHEYYNFEENKLDGPFFYESEEESRTPKTDKLLKYLRGHDIIVAYGALKGHALSLERRSRDKQSANELELSELDKEIKNSRKELSKQAIKIKNLQKKLNFYENSRICQFVRTFFS